MVNELNILTKSRTLKSIDTKSKKYRKIERWFVPPYKELNGRTNKTLIFEYFFDFLAIDSEAVEFLRMSNPLCGKLINS